MDWDWSIGAAVSSHAQFTPRIINGIVFDNAKLVTEGRALISKSHRLHMQEMAGSTSLGLGRLLFSLVLACTRCQPSLF
jgi:hypothetical protein